MAVETEFTNHHILCEAVGTHLFVGSQYAYGERQVVAAALLADVGRTEIDGSIGNRRTDADVADGRLYAVVTLPYGSVGESGEVELYAARDIDFDGNGSGFQPHYCCAECFY